MFEDRYARIQRAIVAAGDDAWLIYGDAQRYGDVAYVSHFVPRLRSVVVLVPKTGKPDILCSIGSRDIPASKILTWFEEMRPYTRLPGEAVKLVNDRGLTAARIGLVGTRQSLPIAEWQAIAAELLGVEWTERDAEYAALRRTKDAAEDDALRRSAAAIAAAHARSGAGPAAGTDRARGHRTDRSCRCASPPPKTSGSSSPTAPAPGWRCAHPMNGCSTRVIRCCCTCRWRSSATGRRRSRTFVLGRPSEAQRALTARAESALCRNAGRRSRRRARGRRRRRREGRARRRTVRGRRRTTDSAPASGSTPTSRR